MSTTERVFKIVAGGVMAGIGYVSYLKGIEWLTKGVFNIED